MRVLESFLAGVAYGLAVAIPGAVVLLVLGSAVLLLSNIRAQQAALGDLWEMHQAQEDRIGELHRDLARWQAAIPAECDNTNGQNLLYLAPTGD